jgi:serine/threonine-protein kinase
VILIRQGELAAATATAVLRPVAAEWDAVTPAMRRLEAAAGAEVEAACRRMGELPVGSAAITAAGALVARFMVHVVVRSREEPVSAAVVRRGLENGLRRLTEWAIESVAMPPLGTGAGNLDAEESARVMVPVLTAHLAAHPHPARVEVVVESAYEREAFERALRMGGAAADTGSDARRDG